jgi:hypothetical protein
MPCGRGEAVRAALLILALFQAAAAAESSVNDLIAMVRASVGAGESDDRLAKALGKLHLTEQLDSRAIEELESEGAGPKSVQELLILLKATEKLPPPATPPPFDSPPRPGPAEQNTFFQDVAKNALQYAKGLPDFICTQVARRYEASVTRDDWRIKDTLTIKLTYFDNKEQYQLQQINGRPTKATYEEAGGAVSEGEFGSMLLNIFSPGHKTQFRWNHWTHLRKRLMQVYAYEGKPQYAGYLLRVGRIFGGSDEAVVGQHGFIYMDNETRMVMRIVMEADSIPADFQVRAHSVALDYGFVDVGGKPFLLPIHAGIHLRTRQVQNRNDVEFRDYRKFGSESTISFGEPEPVVKK